MARIRRKFSAEFKLKAVTEILKGEKTASQLAGELGVNPMVLSEWKKHFLETGPQIFEKPRKSSQKVGDEKEVAELYEQIGRLKMENEWLKKIGDLDLDERKALIEPSNPFFSQRKQCELLSLHRSGLYYEPEKPNEEMLRLMRAIDEEYLLHPFYGKRRMAITMKAKGFEVGLKAVRSAMQKMGLEAIYPKPNLSAANSEHKKYPYLLRNMEITEPNQAWGADITYIPLYQGYGYLFAIIDWYSTSSSGNYLTC